MRPTRGTGRATLCPSIWSCSGRGFPGRLVTQPPVSFCLTISTLPALANQPLAVCFCGTFRRVAPPGCYPASCPVELGLSSRVSERSPGLLDHLYFILDSLVSQTNKSPQSFCIGLKKLKQDPNGTQMLTTRKRYKET